VTLLAAVTFDLGDGHALKADVGQIRPHLLQLEGLDDCSDKLHGEHPLSFVPAPLEGVRQASDMPPATALATIDGERVKSCAKSGHPPQGIESSHIFETKAHKIGKGTA
jgi:hypothetical protein